MIKLGSDQTGHSGVLTCVTDLPGLVTLSASPVGVTLTPSFFTVGGVQTVECAIALSVGLERQSIEFQQSEFTLGFESKFTAGTALYGGYYNFIGIHGGATGVGGKWKLFATGQAGRRFMLQYLNTVSGYGYCNWLHVFPVDTVYRAVVKVEALQATLYWLNGTSLASETLSKVASSTATYPMPTGIRFQSEYNAHQINDFQYRTDFASDAEILAYLLGTGDLGSSLYCKLPMNEESGNIAYDQSGNNRDFTHGGVSLNSYKLIWNGLQRTVTTPFSGQEQLITYDTGSIAPGTPITITATRAKAGFPTGRTPDISVESDTCTVTAAAAPGLAVDGISVDKPTTSLDIGDTETLGFIIYPSTATIRTVTWISSAPTIATIHPTSGLVTGVADGSAVMTATTDDGGFTDTCTVHVPLALVAGVTLNATSISLPIGDTMTLVPTIWPSNASYTGVTWSSSAPTIASVSATGIVSGLLNGSAVITVTTLDGGFTAICAVTVPVTVSLSHSSIDGSGMSGGKGSGSDLIEEDYMMKQDLPDLEMIDFAFVDWIKSLNIFATYPDGWKKVPIIWYGAERSHQIKMEAELRDRSGSEIYPLITVGYNKGLSKDQKKKGVYWANVPAINDYYGGVLTVAKKLKPLKSSEFNNNQSKNRTSYQNGCYMDDTEDSSLLTYEYTSIPIPIYTTKNYEINIKANYQTNINEVLTPFLTYQNAGNDNYFVIEYNNYRYEVFLDAEVKDNSNTKKMAEEERKFESVITGNVLGYIVGDKKNNIRPNIVKREGITKVVVDMGVTDEIPE